MPKNAATRRTPLIAAGILLGVGLGGFVDGIVLHQLLQWHHMVSSAIAPDSVENLKLNTLWDGIFHVAMWVFTVLGLTLLWRALRRRDVPWSTRSLLGSLLLGWGAFNLVEGIIDHHILGIHHVNETVPPSQWVWWDLGFLAFGLALVIIGMYLIRGGRTNQLPVDAVQSERVGFAKQVGA